MNRTTVYLSDGQLKAIDEIVVESKTTENVPEFSQSQAIRELLDAGLDASDDLMALLDEETRVLVERSRLMDKEGKVRNLRTGFETRVKDNFKRRFENGYTADQLQEFALNMRREAELLWPEWAEEDYSERRQEALDYIDEVTEAAVDAAEKSTWDPLDPEAVFSQHSGVEEGMQTAEALDGDLVDELVEQAENLLSTRTTGSGVRPALDPDEVIGRLQERPDVEEEVAVEAVRRALNSDPSRDSSDLEVVADD